RDRPCLAGLETHGGARGDVQVVSDRGVAIEVERRVRRRERIVASDLDGTITSARHGQRRPRTPFVELDVACEDVDVPGYGLRRLRHAERAGCGDGEEAAVEREREIAVL